MSTTIKKLLRGGAIFSLGLAVGQGAGAADLKAQPWRNANLKPELRAEQLFKAMSFEQKVALVSGIEPGEYASLAPLGIPAMTRVDASAGLRGDKGVTAFPVPLALGATFDAALASKYGQAIAVEARRKGWNVILGPTVDVARDGLSGRLTESFGEDPLVNGVLGAAVTRGMQGEGVVAVGKHYTAYASERDRLHVNVKVSERALHEVYNLPFRYLVEQGRIGALMGSYPKINGKHMLESADLIGMIKDGQFKGFMMSDFMGGADGVAQFKAGIDSWALQPFLRKPEAFKDGRIPAARLDDAVRRTLWALFATGTFDQPVTGIPDAVATSPEHQALARRVAEDSTVLLKNAENILPLKRSGQIAVIGPAGKDALTGVMWSTYVDPGQFVTPIEAIAASAGKGAKVAHAQGSIGDFVLPNFGLSDSPFGPPVMLATPDGAPGWKAQYFGNDGYAGAPVRDDVVSAIDVTGKAVPTMPAAWSAKWVTDYTPLQDGAVRLATLVSGTVTVKVDGKVVIDGMRSTASSFPGGGPYSYPLQGVAQLSAGRKARIEVEYSTKGGVMGSRIQLGWSPNSQIPAAVELAKKSDVAVVFVHQVSGEEMDRDNYSLPADQDALVEAVAAANPNTVVVLNTGGAVKMPWLSKVKGVVQMWYPGSAAGTGIAGVLFGDAEPGGRLPVSFPADETQGPKPYKGGGEVVFAEGVDIGYRYLQKHGQKPLFPFGHGLSYTSFAVDAMAVEPLRASEDSAAVTVRVRNTGPRPGAAVVQLYSSSAGTPSKLVGFAKVHLDKGGEQTVRIPVERRLLSTWDEKSNSWVIPAQRVRIGAGLSSEHIVATGDMSLAARAR